MLDANRDIATCWPPHDRFAHYDHLGSYYPYYLKQDPRILHDDMAIAVQALPVKDRVIDPVGVMEILNRGYMLGKRTLVQAIAKAPWMACPDGHGGWQYASIPPHGLHRPDTADLVMRFKEALLQEARAYLHGCKRIGILLSGGMDSRVVAGILRTLQCTGDYTGDVVALTWGIPGCRDVAYSDEVARRYGWDRLHFELGPELLRENIRIAGELGAEFAPHHLHALPKIAVLPGLDAVFGGSYGDSVGRAEFSGTVLKMLRPTVAAHLNGYGIFLESVEKTMRLGIVRDAYAYRKHVQRDYEYQYREVEYQMHCIRRRTQAVVACVGRHMPFHQLFTAPEVFGITWGLDPEIRDNRIYLGLLQLLPGHLGDIPWARTGTVFGNLVASPDTLPKEHHRYGHWLRNELKEEILGLVDSAAVRDLGMFNQRTLDNILAIWPKARTLTISNLDEIISWLAGLSIFVDRYRVQPVQGTNPQLRDHWNTVAGTLRACGYQLAREQMRP